MQGDSFFAQRAPEPLAARMRPRSLEEYVGQQHLLAPGKPLRESIERGTVGSMIFWGPPGTGKTTLARIIARYTDREFVSFSAVTEGVPRVREIVAEAAKRRQLGRGTILFADEIHRFNKAQQDAFLPHVEAGTITLVGATTENPSFEINGALLSRVRVFVLRALSEDDIRGVITRALTDRDRGLGAQEIRVDDDALALLAREALQLRFARFDTFGEQTYNRPTAFHTSRRGSAPQGALYWAMRVVEGGGDPMILFRRAIAMAAEDVGLADPEALKMAIAAREAYHELGPPEGFLPLAEMVVYLATAPKSNSAKAALHAAMEAAQQTPAEGVPHHIRNAPTRLMKELGYGKGYQYAHDVPEAYIPQEYLPEAVRGTEFYVPGPFGFEKEIAKRMAWWAELRRRAAGGAGPGNDSPAGGDNPDG
jgi:putative ATPase